MAHSYKSAIAFALVYIPVKLHKAVKENSTGFNMLDKKTMSRIKYIKTCEECGGKPVKQSDIIKGYEYEDGSYAVFENDELEKIKTAKDKSITIDSFIDIADVDSLYFEESYYVQPAGAEKAYALLTQALSREKKAGLAKTVLGSKESVVLLHAKNGILHLNTLHFYEEVKPVPFSLEEKDAGAKELEMAVSIIRSMQEKFQPQKYKDEYYQKLQKAIADKIAGKQIKESGEKARPKITDLMAALEESVKLMQAPALTKKITKKTAAPIKSAPKTTQKKAAKA